MDFFENSPLKNLARATNGLTVVLEHRYFGHSLPVRVSSAEDYRGVIDDLTVVAVSASDVDIWFSNGGAAGDIANYTWTASAEF